MKALEILNQFRNTNVFATNFNKAMDEAISELEALQNRDTFILEMCNQALGTGCKGHSLAMLEIIKALTPKDSQ